MPEHLDTAPSFMEEEEEEEEVAPEEVAPLLQAWEAVMKHLSKFQALQISYGAKPPAV